MINWIKYLPFEFRFSNVRVAPQEPYFPWSIDRRWELGDVTIHCKCPMSNRVWGEKGLREYRLSPRKGEIFKQLFNTGHGENSRTEGRWHHVVFFGRSWHFVGPWFRGLEATLGFGVTVVSPDNNESFKGVNLFHPRAFESAVADYLDSFYGFQKVGSKPLFRGPLNWRTLDVGDSILAAFFDIHEIGNTSKENPGLLRIIFFPISEQKMIQIAFDFGGVQINGKGKVDPQPMLDLCEKVINSLKIEVGPNTLQKWNAVKAECPDMSIAKEFGELKWPINKKDTGKASPLSDDGAGAERIGSQAKNLPER